MAFWGIEGAKNCTFMGRTIFRRYPETKIQIGSGCTFQSAEWSNITGINRRCMISTLRKSASLIIGDNCGFSGAAISCAESIILGNNVMLGINVIITDTDHHSIYPDQRMLNTGILDKPIVIHDNVWIGANSMVLKGVTIGKNSVIAAGSVVSKDVPENVVFGGLPAKLLKDIR